MVVRGCSGTEARLSRYRRKMGGTAGRDNNRRSRAASLKLWPEVRLRGPPARPSDRSGNCKTGNAILILTSPIKVTLSGERGRPRHVQARGMSRAFSSEVATGSRQENALNQNHRAPLLIPSEAERL
jgi:hypothetical protein